MERFLLLWDELDELVGYGWHRATSLAYSVTRRARRQRRLDPAESPVA